MACMCVRAQCNPLTHEAAWLVPVPLGRGGAGRRRPAGGQRHRPAVLPILVAAAGRVSPERRSPRGLKHGIRVEQALQAGGAGPSPVPRACAPTPRVPTAMTSGRVLACMEFHRPRWQIVCRGWAIRQPSRRGLSNRRRRNPLPQPMQSASCGGRSDEEVCPLADRSLCEQVRGRKKKIKENCRVNSSDRQLDCLKVRPPGAEVAGELYLVSRGLRPARRVASQLP
jgi:hypothetical protein